MLPKVDIKTEKEKLLNSFAFENGFLFFPVLEHFVTRFNTFYISVKVTLLFNTQYDPLQEKSFSPFRRATF
jgi:hypothetical protein